MSQDATPIAPAARARVREGVVQAAHGLNYACMQGMPGASLPVLRRIARLYGLTNRLSYQLHEGKPDHE